MLSIVKFVAVCALLAAPLAVSGAAVKGRDAEPAPTKSGKTLLSPVRALESIKGAPAPLEQVEQVRQLEQAPEEPTKTVRYETKGQVKEEPLIAAPPSLAKGQSQVQVQQQKLAEEPIVQYKQEQQQQQQVQLVEQVKQEEFAPIPQAPILQEQQQFASEELRQQRIEQAPADVKGAHQAPVAEAEPYSFSYQVDGSSRSESGDTKGVVRGQYTLSGADGSSRVVDYVADHNGFRAAVNTNEFGTEARSPAGVNLRSSQPEAQDITLRLEGKTREDLLPPAAAAPQVQQQQISFAGKGAPVPLAPKKQPAQEVPAKGQRLVQQQQEQIKDEQYELVRQEELPAATQAPLKSAEIKAPKALPAETKLRAGFESATAHRAYRPVVPVQVARGPLAVARPRPVVAAVPVPVRSAFAIPPPTPVVGQRVAGYPVSPAHSGYRQRVPLYASAIVPPAAYEDESLDPAGFESAIAN